jgi:hypothetical protein
MKLIVRIIALILMIGMTINSFGNDLTPEKRKAIVDRISIMLNDHYVFPDAAKEMGEDLKRKLKDGDYDEITKLAEFCRQLTRDLYAVSKDKHLSVLPLEKDNTPDQEVDPELIRQRELLVHQKSNFGFSKVERLDGNIGYIKLTGFYNAREGGADSHRGFKFSRLL